MSRTSNDRRNRERPVQASTIDKRHEKIRKSVPQHPAKELGQRRRRFQPSFTPSGVPAKPPGR